MGTVYVILLNWNGWKDTINCLESVFRTNYPHFRVIVCDNLSTDNSIEKIKEWADGKMTGNTDVHEKLRPLVSPPVPKPVRFVQYTREQAEAGGDESDKEVPLVLVRNGSNSGYSAGNNVGIRYAQKKGAAYVWLLNNDTIVTPATLKELVYRLQTDSKTGLVGALVYLASEPSRIQTFGGGRIHPVLGIDRFALEPGNVDFISGISLFIRRETLEQTGLLDEKFFFYWEDADYCRRAQKKGWTIAVAANAVVYHRHSASVGKQSLKSDLFKVSSLTRYFKKHYKWRWMIPVKVQVLGMLAKRCWRRQFNRLIPILKEFLRALFRKI